MPATGTLAWLSQAASLGTSSAPAMLATGEPVDVPVLRMVIVLALGIGLAVLIAHVLRDRASLVRVFKPLKIAGNRTTGAREPGLKVLETHRLSAHGDVGLVACGNKRFVVVMSQGSAVVLDTYDVVQEPQTAAQEV